MAQRRPALIILPPPPKAKSPPKAKGKAKSPPRKSPSKKASPKKSTLLYGEHSVGIGGVARCTRSAAGVETWKLNNKPIAEEDISPLQSRVGCPSPKVSPAKAKASPAKGKDKGPVDWKAKYEKKLAHKKEWKRAAEAMKKAVKEIVTPDQLAKINARYRQLLA